MDVEEALAMELRRAAVLGRSNPVEPEEEEHSAIVVVEVQEWFGSIEDRKAGSRGGRSWSLSLVSRDGRRAHVAKRRNASPSYVDEAVMAGSVCCLSQS